jgi:acyl carrier protein
MTASPEENVYEFVSRYCGVKRQALTPQTRLVEDLGLEGDDAEEFIQSFSQTFSVDLTEFEFRKYFGVEAAVNPISLVRFFLPKKRVPIEIGQLVAAAARGRWAPMDSAK